MDVMAILFDLYSQPARMDMTLAEYRQITSEEGQR